MRIRWEWLHEQAPVTGPDAETGVNAGETLTHALFTRRLEVKPLWYVALLNLNRSNDDLPKARAPRAVPQPLEP